MFKQEFITEVESIAKEASKIIRKYYESGVENNFKSERSMVSSADIESEKYLKAKLLSLHACEFYGEESGGTIVAQGDQWVIDPLDNSECMSGYPPLIAISIGLLRNSEPIFGLIYDPIHNTVYKGHLNGNVYTNESIVEVSTCIDINKAMVSFDFSSHIETRKQTLQQLGKILPYARSIKLFGSPVLSLANVASGRLDLFFRPSTKLPDMVAGVALVRAAGGKVIDFTGQKWTIHSKGIIAGNPELVSKYFALIKEQ